MYINKKPRCTKAVLNSRNALLCPAHYTLLSVSRTNVRTDCLGTFWTGDTFWGLTSLLRFDVSTWVSQFTQVASLPYCSFLGVSWLHNERKRHELDRCVNCKEWGMFVPCETDMSSFARRIPVCGFMDNYFHAPREANPKNAPPFPFCVGKVFTVSWHRSIVTLFTVLDK
jgi:hypothetical protein